MTSLLPGRLDSPPTKKSRIVECTKTQDSFAVCEAMEHDGITNNGLPKPGNVANGSDKKEHVLDHNLYSRQIYTLGESAMMHLRSASVLISGMGGLGVEIAKNLILGGVRHVQIHDTKKASYDDLSAQYYLQQDDVGKNRAFACFERLAELNDSVTCTLNTDPLAQSYVSQFDLTVLTDAPRSLQLQVAEWTRAASRRLLVADARGSFSFVFVDFGKEMRVDDANGEHCKEFLIEHVDGESGDVTTLEHSMHGLEDGDYVTFEEVKGMTELNGIRPIRITVKKPSVFNIGDAAKSFAQYTEGGRVKQVKVPFTVSHKSLQESLSSPEFCMWDFGKMEFPPQLHALWTALYAFEEKHNRSPRPRNNEDVLLLKAEIPAGAEVDDKLLTAFSYQATGNLVTVCSVLGGIAAQEAMKGVTHHTTPLNQWLYLDALDALPGQWTDLDTQNLSESDCAPRGSRYDGQAAVFGWKYQEALLNQRWFIVGAGAIGCELLKNMAMMGVGCGEKGYVKVTDMDQIEISNLNRQFLFRRKDVGSKKSECAARAASAFNPSLHVFSLSERVGPDTESVFDDAFFSDLHGVANALDNVDARRYMDRRCVYYRLPLLESGTMGTKGNTQVVYPHLTESYSSSVDPPEKEIPICTLKNFPNEIQHTIQWARDLFEGVFSEAADTSNAFLKDQRAFLDRIEQMNVTQGIQMLTTVKKALIDNRPSNAADCVHWARQLFQENYHDAIAQMLHSFPPDQVTDSGVKFWSGSKRCPHVLEFDPSKEEHLNFVYSASILRAQQYGIEPLLDRQKVIDIALTTPIVPFTPRANVRIAVTDQEARENNDNVEGDTDEVKDGLKLRLARLPPNTSHLIPIDFEKDDDTNHHMEFVTAASNLRAENYDIAVADQMKTKQIAGRIIPAIATTTAAISGLVCVELHKTVLADHEYDGKARIPLSVFKNGFINLALPFFAFSEPIEVPKTKYGTHEFTLWDRLEISGPKTLRELMDWVESTCKVKVRMVSAGVSLIYSFFMDVKKRSLREGMEVKSVVEEVSHKFVPSHARSIVLEIMASDVDSGEDVEIPYVKYDLA